MRFIALLLLCLSSSAFADGLLLFKPSHDYHNKKDKQIYGLQVNEWLWKKNLKYVGWLEHGRTQTEYDKNQWYKTEQGLEFDYSIVGVGLGGLAHYNPDSDYREFSSYATLSVHLWQ